MTMNEYEHALELKEETIANRRFLHENAETGLHLPETKAFVMKKLKEYGIEPVECGEGVTLQSETEEKLFCFEQIWMRFR